MHAGARACAMKGGYKSVKSSEPDAQSGVDGATATLAMVVSFLSCVVSLAAIGFVVLSLRAPG